MVVGVGGVPVGAQQRGGARAGKPSRRDAARGLFASLAALALAPVVAASRPAPPRGGLPGGSFEETYRGRRIRGVPVPVTGGPVAGGLAADADWQVTVDDRPLHLMRRADGSWLSMIDHYSSYPTPLAATRAAVDELRGRRLRDLAPGPMGGAPGRMHMGGDHGVRA